MRRSASSESAVGSPGFIRQKRPCNPAMGVGGFVPAFQWISYSVRFLGTALVLVTMSCLLMSSCAAP